MVRPKKIPMRKCTGCGEMKPKQELVRVVKAPDAKNEQGEVVSKGKITLDLTGKLPGRGAYVCADINCLNKAIKAHRLERAFSTSIPDEIYENLKREMEKGE